MSRFLVLMYHMVSEPKEPRDARFACPPGLFRRHMEYLARHGYAWVSLEHIHGALTGGTPLPERAVAVTLDDGYADNYEYAWPVLARYGIPATIFLVTDAVGRTNHWMEGRGFSSRRMLSWSQVREMSDHGVSFGSHTASHPRLTELPAHRVEEELTCSRRVLEDKLGRSVFSFAYPYGLVSEGVRDAVVRAGYGLACSTRSGFNRVETDRFQLRRIEVYGTDGVWRLAQKIRFGMNDASLLYPVKYYWNRALARWNGRDL
ncbi:Polysaccharide deacetylase [Desulfacinum hydrothermale DSM 13146]|uniref:Polysaccharide deacetylase n=1 Tax=Desulfacinum hydrothermale DSM 13146 TaxID=1121390 RepID=A0A1W1XR19_9BACT|nr:polysaccharide deacetylase family protein [Desulfacinum hydrothermale]SMC26327.1 Polysaccharide deacetylase [Desulfacinum hydrothermale DSM 13146]